MADEESKLKQIKEKVQGWKNEGYNVDELEHKVNSTKIKHPAKNSKKKFVIVMILIVLLFVVALVIYLGPNFLGDVNPINIDENIAPTLEQDYIVLDVNSNSNIIDVLANDVDPGDDFLSIIGVGDASNGVVEIIDNKLVYTPSKSFTGVETISYKVSDGKDEVYSTVNIVVVGEYPIATIDTSKGTIMLELYGDKVPNTCDNFIRLAEDGFYDGLIFHRVMDDFMIQAGNTYPNGTTKASPYGTIDLELDDDVKHIDGAISMARTNEPNSATSQFFICDGAQPGLDGSYAAFGKTIVGISVVRDIADEPHDGSYGEVGGGRPYTDVIINTITVDFLNEVREEP